MARTDGDIIIGTSVDVGGINTGLKSIQSSFKSLSKYMTLAAGVGGLIRLGKSALDAASDLQEVQNIVDVSFGDMKYKIEEFAATSIQKFGMSQLAAKQTAGSFMAMGHSMGLTGDEASDMAVKLTGLTGDFASFYNLSQDYARTAMSAVYTGETETLKRYGIILTEANLQEYASTQGITEKVHAMSAREKLMLRYNYILSVTDQVEGDFVRTQNTWANQTRVLKEVWKQFLITIGDGLITVFTPMVKQLNTILLMLTAVAKKVEEILASVFHVKLQSVTQNLAQTTQDTADSASDAADAEGSLASGIDKATKSAKKALAPFDDLNVLQDETSNSGSSSSGVGGDLDTSGLDAAKEKTDMFLTGLGDDMKVIYDLGKDMSESFSKMLMGIDWNSIYAKAANFGTGLATFLNGLIQPDTFTSVGYTIASALNTAVYAALSFGTTFDWANLGVSVADSINSFFDTFDFSALGESVNTFVQGIADEVKAFFKELDWASVLNGAFDFFEEIDIGNAALVVGTVTITKVIKWAIAENAIGGLAKLVGSKLAEAASYVIGGAASIKEIPEALAVAFGPVGTVIAGVVAVVGGLILAVTSFFSMLTGDFSWLKEALMILGIAIAAIGAVILGAPVAIAAIVAAIVAVVANLVIAIVKNWDKIKAGFENAWKAITDSFKKFGEFVGTVFDAVKGKISVFCINAINFLVGIPNAIQAWILMVVAKVAWLGQKIKSGISSFISTVKTTLQNTATWIYNHVCAPIFNGVKGIINGIISAVERMLNSLISGINFMTKALGKIGFTLPDWIPGIGGKSLKISIPQIGYKYLPRLATGAVIPPNKEFAAVLGDQTKGTNIETPENLLRKIYREEMANSQPRNYGGMNTPVELQIDGKSFAHLVAPYVLSELDRMGYNVKILGY